jgi:hypothetical protein
MNLLGCDMMICAYNVVTVINTVYWNVVLINMFLTYTSYSQLYM